MLPLKIVVIPLDQLSKVSIVITCMAQLLKVMTWDLAKKYTTFRDYEQYFPLAQPNEPIQGSISTSPRHRPLALVRPNAAQM